MTWTRGLFLDRIYLDTNIFFYAFYSKKYPDKSRSAKNILNSIANGVFSGVISLLVLQEIISGLRKVFFKELQMTSVDNIETRIYEIIQNILQIPYLELFQSEQNFSKIELDSFLLLHQYPGEISPEGYKFIHPLDAMHIEIAKEAHCIALYTAEKSFENLGSEIPIRLI